MKVCCDTEGRELTDERRYAPTSVPLRRKPCSRSPETLFHFTGIPTPGAFVRHAWRLVSVAHLVWPLSIWLLVGFFFADPVLWRRQLAPFRRRRGVRLCSAWLDVAATSALFDSLFRAPRVLLRCAQRPSLCSAASRSCFWCPCVARLFSPFHGGAWRLVSGLAPSAWRTVSSGRQPPRGGWRSAASSLDCRDSLSLFSLFVASRSAVLGLWLGRFPGVLVTSSSVPRRLCFSLEFLPACFPRFGFHLVLFTVAEDRRQWLFFSHRFVHRLRPRVRISLRASRSAFQAEASLRPGSVRLRR